jgi:hypothetical protein
LKRLTYSITFLLFGVVALSACGSSHGSGGTAAAGSGGGAGSAAASGHAGKVVDVCTVLNAATAAKLSGQPYTQAVKGSTGWTSECAYNNDSSTAEGVNVNYSNENATSTWNTVHTGAVTDVNGLGDKAFWDNDNTLYVLAGPDLIQVNGLSSADKSEALAKLVLDALG